MLTKTVPHGIYPNPSIDLCVMCKYPKENETFDSF